MDNQSSLPADGSAPEDHPLAVDARNVVMRFGGTLALKRVDVRSEAGEFTP